MDRNYEIALEALDRSLALSPSSALAFGFSSIIHAWMGEHAIAIEHSKMGIRLSPYDSLIYLPLVGLAFAHFFAGFHGSCKRREPGIRGESSVQRAPLLAHGSPAPSRPN